MTPYRRGLRFAPGRPRDTSPRRRKGLLSALSPSPHAENKATKCFRMAAISISEAEPIFSKKRSFETDLMCSIQAWLCVFLTKTLIRVGQSFNEVVNGTTITVCKALFMELGLTIRQGLIPSCSLPRTGYNFTFQISPTRRFVIIVL